ncbi:MAG: sugar isomerase domain-containing protein [Candidatus Bipolaricaulia bacterium]
MDAMEKYLNELQGILGKIQEQEKANIEKTVDIISEALEGGKLIHIFGTGGHSAIGAMEVFYRAGGLVPINPLFPPGISVMDSHPNTERVVGYAKSVLDYYGVKQDDVIIIVNVNGINAVTIDSALESKERGATVIAVTSSEFSKNVPPDIPARHPSNKDLYELGDIVIDAHVPVGDAVVEIEGLDLKVAPSSTMAICFILNSVIALVVERLIQTGVTPPVWKSANMPGGDEANKRYRDEYFDRIRHLY